VRIDRGAGTHFLRLPIEIFETTVLGLDATVADSTNPFYVVKVLAFQSTDPEEKNESNNDNRTGAESLSIGTNGGSFVSRLYTMTDVDHWSFYAGQSKQVAVACFAQTEGSGVRGLTISLLDMNGNTMPGGPATETASASAFVPAVTIPESGTYYVKLTKTGQDPDVSSTHVRCQVTITE
jgi:hypothetical protein